MRPLSDELLQSWEDDASDVIAEIAESGDNGRSACWPFWIERYVEGDIVIHLHYSVIRVGDRDGHYAQYCAVLEGAGPDAHTFDVKVYAAHLSDSDCDVGGDGGNGLDEL